MSNLGTIGSDSTQSKKEITEQERGERGRKYPQAENGERQRDATTSITTINTKGGFTNGVLHLSGPGPEGKAWETGCALNRPPNPGKTRLMKEESGHLKSSKHKGELLIDSEDGSIYQIQYEPDSNRREAGASWMDARKTGARSTSRRIIRKEGGLNSSWTEKRVWVLKSWMTP